MKMKHISQNQMAPYLKAQTEQPIGEGRFK
jgi:hypothetical protein